MEALLKSEGKCVYCDKTFLQKEISKHLKSHFLTSEQSYPTVAKAFHIAIESDYMFLQVLVDGNATFKVLDNFLREIWVDCCEHFSGFSFKGEKISLREKFENVLVPQAKIRYDYDLGNTTTFYCTVAGMYKLSMKEPLLLLSRNEPLKIMCRICKKKPASAICTFHKIDSEDYLFCDNCAERHKQKCEAFRDYANLPVVNSPRMGVCEYAGGSIDMERDDAFGK